jgi:hypothetical protein
MKLRAPEILLLLYWFLPIGGEATGRIVLDQVRAMRMSRLAEKKLAIDIDNDSNEALKDFFRAFRLDPTNAAAYTYLELLAPELGWFDQGIQAIRYKIDNDNFEFSTNAVDQLITQQIQIHEIKESIANGQLIQGDERGDATYMIGGLTQAQRPICIKCSSPSRSVFNIIAIYEIDRELWNDNFTPRISNNHV